MYCILVYDIGERRVVKMLKHCRKYLNWIQNSVFEGELSESQLMRLKAGAKEIMNKNEDSVIIFTSSAQKWLKKEVIGIEKSNIDNFI